MLCYFLFLNMFHKSSYLHRSLCQIEFYSDVLYHCIWLWVVWKNSTENRHFFNMNNDKKCIQYIYVTTSWPWFRNFKSICHKSFTSCKVKFLMHYPQDKELSIWLRDTAFLYTRGIFCSICLAYCGYGKQWCSSYDFYKIISYGSQINQSFCSVTRWSWIWPMSYCRYCFMVSYIIHKNNGNCKSMILLGGSLNIVNLIIISENVIKLSWQFCCNKLVLRTWNEVSETSIIWQHQKFFLHDQLYIESVIYDWLRQAMTIEGHAVRHRLWE